MDFDQLANDSNMDQLNEFIKNCGKQAVAFYGSTEAITDDKLRREITTHFCRIWWIKMFGVSS